MYKILFLLSICFWSTSAFAENDGMTRKNESSTELLSETTENATPSKEDMKVIAVLEILELMEVVEEMDMMKDLDYLIEEDQNEN